MGVTGSLLAAVAACFALTGGILGFNSWPSAGPATADRALRVASPTPRAERAAPLALPITPAGGPAPAAGPLVTAGGGVRSGAQTTPVERRRSTTRVPQPVTSPPSASQNSVGRPAPATAAPAAPTQPAAPTLVTDTTRAAAGVVRSVTASASQLPAAGPAIAAAGEAVAGVVAP